MVSPCCFLGYIKHRFSTCQQGVEKMWKTSSHKLFSDKTFYVLLCPQTKIDLWQLLDNPEKLRLHAQ